MTTLMELLGKWREESRPHGHVSGNAEADRAFENALAQCADQLDALVRQWDTQPVAWSPLVRRYILGTVPKEGK